MVNKKANVHRQTPSKRKIRREKKHVSLPPIDRGRDLVKKAAYSALALLLVAAAFNIWYSYLFLAEDAFFILRYAYNLAAGHGMVYNPDEYYDGSTNFLWTIFLTPPFLFDWEPVIYVRVIGMLVALAVLALVYVVTERLDNTVSVDSLLFIMAVLVLRRCFAGDILYQTGRYSRFISDCKAWRHLFVAIYA